MILSQSLKTNRVQEFLCLRIEGTVYSRDLPGGPVVKTLCKGCGFDP